MAVGAVIGGALGLAGSVYGAKKNKEAARDAAAMAATNPYNVSGPFGSINFQDGTANFDTSGSPFAQLMGGIAEAGAANYGFTQADPYQALTPELRGQAGFYDTLLGGQTMQAQSGADSIFGALEGMGWDPQEAATNRYNLLTQQAAPGANRMFNQLQDRLFAQGRLGTSGGSENLGAFFEAQGQADIGRQMAGADYAMRQQGQLSDMFGNFSNMAAGRSSDRFNLAQNLLGTADARRQNMFGNAMSAQNAMFNPLLQAGNLGVAAGGGNPAGAQMMLDANEQSNNAWSQAAGQIIPAATQWATNRWGGGGASGPTMSSIKLNPNLVPNPNFQF